MITSTCKILVVEDNPVNLKLVTVLLKAKGFQFTCATNGLEALTELEKNHFDIIIMDCQMPVMDGYEATIAIRKNEESTGKHIPILALTANAMTYDRQKCLDAGMDEYLTKPINKDALYNMIEQLLPSHGESPVQVDPVESVKTESETLFNKEELLERVGGDSEFMLELVNMFIEHAPGTIQELETAVSSNDMSATRSAAHKLKGMTSSMSAHELAKEAAILEEHATSPKKDDSLIDRTIAKIRDQYAGLMAAFVAMRTGLAQ